MNTPLIVLASAVAFSALLTVLYWPTFNGGGSHTRRRARRRGRRDEQHERIARTAEIQAIHRPSLRYAFNRTMRRRRAELQTLARYRRGDADADADAEIDSTDRLRTVARGEITWYEPSAALVSRYSDYQLTEPVPELAPALQLLPPRASSDVPCNQIPGPAAEVEKPAYIEAIEQGATAEFAAICEKVGIAS